MAKPIILAVDDEPVVLNSVERDLRQKYGREYRVMKSESGEMALAALKQLQARGESVALFIADQRMPEMNGTQFLEQAIELFPEAKKVLLTAYADTEAAIRSINRINLDYYLMKPWDPPQENLYPVLDDLLADWKVSASPSYDGIRVAGALWSPQSHAVKDFLARHQIAYQWLDVDSNPDGRALADSYSDGAAKLPVVSFPDGSVFIEPSLQDMANKVGMQTRAEARHYEIIIIGAGPAGLSAAVYGASEGHNVLVIEKHAPGGQAGNSPKIENYLGFPAGLSGMDLARRAITQAKRFGAEILSATEVVNVRIQDQYRIVTLADGTELSCKALLLASGATFRRLDVPGVEKLTGSGVYYGAAYTEARYYQDQHVFVIGGANSAGQGAMFLSKFASKVTMLIRRDTQWSSKYLVDAEAANPKIERLFNTEVTEVVGEPGHVSHIVTLNNITNEVRNLEGAAVFIFIGAMPNSGIVRDLVSVNDKGFIITGPDLIRNGKRPKGWTLKRDPLMLETSVPGIFAAGDVRLGTNQRVASATGEGGVAIAAIQQYLSTI
ncbi:MAG TPA: FAD-dependent oxidoreductase [Anaerolineales bacterium]